MIRMDAAVHFQELLLEGMHDSQFLPAALDRLNEYCGSNTAQLIAVNSSSLILDSAVSGTVDKKLFEKEAEYLPINPRTNAFATMPVGRIFNDRDLVDEETISTNIAFQEFLIPAGIGQFSGAILARGKDHLVGLAIARPYEDGPFESDVVAKFGQFVRSAMPVVQLAEQVIDTRAASVVEIFGPHASVAILDKDGLLLKFSGPFERLLSAGTLRRDHFGRIDMLSDETNQHLAMALRGGGGVIGGRFCFTRLRPERTFVCTVTPVPPMANFGGRSGHAILLLDQLSTPRWLDRRLLQQAFSMTDAECDVCGFLYDGEILADIATKRGVAVSTVKSLLKSIMLKTGARRQAEIIIRLSRFAFETH